MDIQDTIWSISLTGIGLIALVFVYVVSRARREPADQAAVLKFTRTARTLRTGLFTVLFLGFIAGGWATLHPFPIPPQHGALDAKQVVDVVGYQWFWQITPAVVESDSVVKFRVTSKDVHHGFAIYSPDGRILVQTQAMPGYTNELLYTFDRPGTYTIHCLEYCGIGHAPMKATLEVVSPQEG